MLAEPTSLVLITPVFDFHQSSSWGGWCDSSSMVLVVGSYLRVLWWRGLSMGSSTIGDSNFPITIALVGWFGFSFDLFDSTYPNSLFISQQRAFQCWCGSTCEMVRSTLLMGCQRSQQFLTSLFLVNAWTVAKGLYWRCNVSNMDVSGGSCLRGCSQWGGSRQSWAD